MLASLDMLLHCLALAIIDVSMFVAADLSSGSPPTGAGTESRICPMLGKDHYPRHETFYNASAHALKAQSLTRLKSSELSRLKETKENTAPHMQAKTEVKGMLLLGSQGSFMLT